MNLRDENEEEFVLNLTSMSDIVFLMLIFFMLATTYTNPEHALGVELPHASSESRTPPEELVINVLEDGTYVLGGEIVSREALAQRLAEAAREAPETPVTIRGHRLAHHEAIVAVMDACGLAGLHNLSIGTTREDRG